MVDNIPICISIMLTIEVMTFLQLLLHLHLFKTSFRHVNNLQMRIQVVHYVSICVPVMLSVKVVSIFVEFYFLWDYFSICVSVMLRFILPFVTLFDHFHMVLALCRFIEHDLFDGVADSHQHHLDSLDPFVLGGSRPLLLSYLDVKELL